MEKTVNPYSNEVKMPEQPTDIRCMTAQELDAALEKGYAQMKAGQMISAQQVFGELREELDV